MVAQREATSPTCLVFSCGHVIFWQKYLMHISLVDLLNKNLLYNFSLSLPFMLAGCQCSGQLRKLHVTDDRVLFSLDI